MTTTAVLSGQSIGTSTNVGNDLTFAASTMKVTIQTTTTTFVVSAKLTNGAGSYNLGSRPVVWYASSPFSVVYTAAPALFRNGGARYLEMVPSTQSGLAVAKTSSLETVNGSYIYVWCDVPTVSVAQTLDISVVELP